MITLASLAEKLVQNMIGISPWISLYVFFLDVSFLEERLCFSNTLVHSSPHLPLYSTEVEFLEEIQTEVLRVFLLAIHRHLY